MAALAPVLLGARRPVLLNYARLIKKTILEFEELSKDWRVATNYTFLSIEKLSLEAYANWLEEQQPDLVVVDEAHSLSDPNGARFKRIARYKCPRLFLTGTPGIELAKQAHIQELMHGEESPLPRNYELDYWAQAVDPDVQGIRRAPGILGSTVDEARKFIQKRISRTQGNVYYQTSDGVECSLYASTESLTDASMDSYLDAALCDGQLPDGRVFEEVYDRSLILKQLGLGFAKVLDPMPPESWRAARRAWAAFVYEIKNRAEFRLDTPAQIASAIRRGEIDDSGIYAYWREVLPTFTPTHKTEWLSLTAVEKCAGFDGLIWTTTPTFGRKLAEVAGIPFFHVEGNDAMKGSIETYGGGPCVLSYSANRLGRNLQNRWSKNLFVSSPGDADGLSQALGRTVRFGQKSPIVEATFLLAVIENLATLHRARTTAAAGGDLSNRLLLGDWVIPSLAEAQRWHGARWQR